MTQKNVILNQGRRAGVKDLMFPPQTAKSFDRRDDRRMTVLIAQRLNRN
jgi:hypothetical protein